MIRQRTTAGLIGIFLILTRGVIALFLLSYAAAAQSVQTIDSEAQLASMLCRSPTARATNEQLLNKHAQLVTVTLWNAVVSCALSAGHQQLAARSVEIYQLSLRIADRLNKSELVATSYYYLGRTYARLNDLDNSIHAYETSETSFEQAGMKSNLVYVRADLGALYLTVEDYEKAKTYSERSLAIAGQMKSTAANDFLPPIDYGRARALQTLGQIDLHRGNHEEALNKLHAAQALYEGLNGTGSFFILQLADVLIAEAEVHSDMGQYAQALSLLTKAHQVSRSSGDQNTLANIMSAQAAVFLEQQDYATAETYSNASLAIYQSLGNARQEARVLLNLGVIEQREDHRDEALQLFRRSIERANTAKSVDVQIAAGQGLGAVLTAIGDFPSALKAINESLELARRVNAKPREGELLWQAAQTSYAMRNYRESAVLAEQSLALARSLQLPKLTYLATAAVGEAYAADGKVESAITTLEEAIKQVEALRDHVAGRQESRQLFFEDKVGPYRTMVELLTRQGKNFAALLYAERAKGRVLLEAVRNNRTDLKDIYTEDEKAEGDFLINKLHAINQQIQSQTSSAPKDELQNELNGVRRELVSFQERLAAAHPELPLRAGPAKSLTQTDLNSLVPANDFAYLEFVVTGNNVGLFILKRNALATEHDLKYIPLAVNTDELRRKVNEFHSALAERLPGYDSLGRDLYQLLVEPAAAELQNITTVCIVPDEFIWTLPFQALTTTRGNYVIKEYSLFYAPSLTVLNEMALRRRQQSNKESLIAFGNPLVEGDQKLNENLHPLPETEAEVAAVAAAVRTTMKRVLTGRKADEKSFKALAPQYATIHVATHGVLDNGEPLNSHLLLTRIEGDLENDGLLQAREIINLRLDADLAVLSACETGNGRISPGEGVIGMSWAFLVAGSRSVVVSQWRVNSASTAQLMTNFYQALARQNDSSSRNKSQALREASLRLLRDRRYRHPFYWAGFVLVSSN